jgi:predicted metal-dependent phosphoesterase TrpH
LKYCPDIGQVGRPHFAEFLLEKGYIKTRNEAFDRWLGNGKVGDVKTGWPTMQQAVKWITDAGGIAVLAHPLRYKMTFTKLRLLVSAFTEAGGQAVEIVGQQAQPDQLKSLQKLLLQHDLAASGGSDFHDPEWAWAQIGKLEPLPENFKPVWTLFKQSKTVNL